MKTTISPTDITLALADLHPDDWATVLGFTRNLAARANATTPAEKAYRDQADLVYLLKELHVLVDACCLALQSAGNDEVDSVTTAMMMASNGLFDLYEQQELRAKALEAVAYQEDGEDAA